MTRQPSKDGGADAVEPGPSGEAALLGHAVARLYEAAETTAPASLSAMVDVLCEIVGARKGRLLVADYAVRSLHEVGPQGRIGQAEVIEGTLAGRVFADGKIVVSGLDPTLVRFPLLDGTERIGMLELEFESWDETVGRALPNVVRTFVLLLISSRRYSDAWVRARRAQPMSAAAEMQWDLLPPLAATANEVSVAGILEPAYAIGGDSFDYALNPRTLDFAIVDAVGHEMSAVLMAAAAINGLRNIRREGMDLPAAYSQVDELIATHFGRSRYVTGLFGSLEFETGVLRWINAGHVLPMLVRNGTYAGELTCRPSMPMGLGGTVVQIGENALQSGDRVLLYTDGIPESKSDEGEFFGTDRLADYLVRATLEGVPVAETVRRLTANVVSFVRGSLKDDATMVLMEYRRQPHAPQ